MLEIIVMIGVIGWFSRTAKAKGKSGVLWGIVGALSYYGPVLIFGRFIYPSMVRGSVTNDNQFGYIALGIALDLAVGIGCCLLARQVLTSTHADDAPPV
jgi:hypothetical protein